MLQILLSYFQKSTYKCTYCELQKDSWKPMIEHLILAHDTHVISYQETIWEQDTGYLVLTTKSTDIKPCDHIIILDETFSKISIEVKWNFQFNPNKKQKLDTKKAFMSKILDVSIIINICLSNQSYSQLNKHRHCGVNNNLSNLFISSLIKIDIVVSMLINLDLSNQCYQ